MSDCVSGSHASTLYVNACRLPAVGYPVFTVAFYAFGYYIVFFGPQKVSSAVDDLNSALAELRQRRRADIPVAVSPAQAPTRIEWLMTDRALLSLGLHSRRVGMGGEALASIPESIPESEVDDSDPDVS